MSVPSLLGRKMHRNMMSSVSNATKVFSGMSKRCVGSLGHSHNLLKSSWDFDRSGRSKVSLVSFPNTSLHTLKHVDSQVEEATYMELRKNLPPRESPEFHTKQKWIMHLANHKNTVSADFVAQLGHAVVTIDVRLEKELTGPVGYIPGVHWFPRTEVQQIINSFPKDALIAIICGSDVESSRVVEMLRLNGFTFPAVLAGGMKTWKLMGFSTSRDPAILNRRCKVIGRSSPSPCPINKAGRRQMTLQQLSGHLSQGDGIQWIKMAAFMVHGRMSCVDGRDDCGVIGTPGGDMGEFLIGLTVAEMMLQRQLTEAEVAILFQRRLDAFGRFYMHTDQHSLNAMLEQMLQDESIGEELLPHLKSTFAKNNFIAKVPAHLRENIIKYIIKPEFIGCGHIRFLLTDPVKYQVRSELVIIALRCFFYSIWEGSTECDYVVLTGNHDECGVANVTLSDEVHPFTKIPLISPSIQGNQVFVNHDQISTYLRHQMADWILCQKDVLPFTKTAAAAYQPLMDLIAASHTHHTLSKLAVDLPLYTLKFDDNGYCQVHYNGMITAPEDISAANTKNAQNREDNAIPSFLGTFGSNRHAENTDDESTPVIEYKAYEDNMEARLGQDIERVKLMGEKDDIPVETTRVTVESDLASQFTQDKFHIHTNRF